MKLRAALSFVKHRKIESCALGFSLMVFWFCCWKCQNLHTTSIHLQSLQTYTEACDPSGFNLTALQGQAQRLEAGGGRAAAMWPPELTLRPSWDHKAWLRPILCKFSMPRPLYPLTCLTLTRWRSLTPAGSQRIYFPFSSAPLAEVQVPPKIPCARTTEASSVFGNVLLIKGLLVWYCCNRNGQWKYKSYSICVKKKNVILPPQQQTYL